MRLQLAADINHPPISSTNSPKPPLRFTLLRSNARNGPTGSPTLPPNTVSRSLGDKLQTIALTQPAALALVERFLDQLIGQM